MQVQLNDPRYYVVITDRWDSKIKATLHAKDGTACCGVYKPAGTLIDEVIEYFYKKIEMYDKTKCITGKVKGDICND